MESAECQTVRDGKFEFMGLQATDGGSWQNFIQEALIEEGGVSSQAAEEGGRL